MGLLSFGKPYDGLEDNDCGYATHCERRYIVTTRLPEKKIQEEGFFLEASKKIQTRRYPIFTAPALPGFILIARKARAGVVGDVGPEIGGRTVRRMDFVRDEKKASDAPNLLALNHGCLGFSFSGDVGG